MIRFTDEYYYEDDGNGFWNNIRDCVIAILSALAVCLIASLFVCCTTYKAAETIEKHDSTASVSVLRSDSISYKEVVKERFVEHFLNTTYIVSPLGDTLKEKTYEKVEINNNTKERDSIALLTHRLDSLSQIKKQSNVKVFEKQLSKWERTKIDTYEYVLVALLACVVTITGYIFYKVKIC